MEEQLDERSKDIVCCEWDLSDKYDFPQVDTKDYHHPLFNDVNAIRKNDSQPSIHELNDECLDFILSFFNTIEHFQFSLVCKRWYNLCLSKISRINHFSVYHLRRLLNLETITAFSPIDGRFTVSQSRREFCAMDIISVLSINQGSLTTLYLSDVSGLDAKSFFILAGLVPNLTTLKIAQDFKLNEDICNIMAWKIVPNLEAFSLYLQSIPNKSSLLKILSRARRLKFLSLKESGRRSDSEDETNIWDYDSSALEFLAASNPMKFVSFYGHINLHCNSLNYMLRSFSDQLEYLNLSDTNLEGLSKLKTDNLPILKKMKVFLAHLNQNLIDEEDIIPLSQHNSCSHELAALLKLMPNLKILDLSNNYHLRFNNVDIIDILVNYCPMIEELNLSNCAVSSDKLANLKQLKYIRRLILGPIHACSPPQEDIGEFIDLVDNFRCITYQVLPSLKDLEYFAIEDVMHAFSVNDIVFFVDNCGPKFKNLSLSSFYDICEALVHSEFDRRHNFIEDAARMCKENCKGRDSVINIFVNGLDIMHRNSCNSLESRKNCTCLQTNFDDIAPGFLKIRPVKINEEYYFDHYYPEIVSMRGEVKIKNEYINIPTSFLHTDNIYCT